MVSITPTRLHFDETTEKLLQPFETSRKKFEKSCDKANEKLQKKTLKAVAVLVIAVVAAVIFRTYSSYFSSDLKKCLESVFSILYVSGSLPYPLNPYTIGR